MKNKNLYRILFFLLLFQFPAVLDAARFEREDWIYTYEPTHPQYWGIQWGENNLLLPTRILQRTKHFLESRFANNWRFGFETGGVKGFLLRFLSTELDFGMMIGFLNLHHSMGHDAAAREHARRFGIPGVPSRYQQVLPKFLGGDSLESNERNLSGGPDYQTQSLVQPMQAEIHFAYGQGKEIIQDQVNSIQALNFIFYRFRFYLDRIQEDGVVEQGFLDFNAKSYGSASTITPEEIRKYAGNKTYSTDFTHYVIQLNQRRYGVNQVSQFRYNMDDIYKTYYYQLLDPLQWITLWQYSKDYIVHGRDKTHIPMIPITQSFQYLPSLRTYLGPLGTVFYIDNYFRYEKIPFNVYGIYGNNGYEKSSGFGIDIFELVLWRYTRMGIFGELQNQPNLSRLLDTNPLSPSEIGETHLVYNIGGSIKFPIYFLDSSEDPSAILAYVRGGTKNDGWIPGEYLNSGAYLQIGIGLHY